MPGHERLRSSLIWIESIDFCSSSLRELLVNVKNQQSQTILNGGKRLLEELYSRKSHNMIQVEGLG